MLHQHHWAKSVGLEREERILILYLVRRFLWEQETGDAETEVEVVFFHWEEIGGFAPCFDKGLFICN